MGARERQFQWTSGYLGVSLFLPAPSLRHGPIQTVPTVVEWVPLLPTSQAISPFFHRKFCLFLVSQKGLPAFSRLAPVGFKKL